MAIDLTAPPAPPSSDSKFLGIPEDFSVNRGKKQVRKKEYENFMGPVGQNAYDEIDVVDKPIAGQGGFTWGSTGERIYQKGDEFRPGQGNDGNTIAQLQQQLVQAGLMPKGARFVLGRWDETSRDAYKKLLEYANGQGTTDEAALQELLSAPVVDLSQTQRDPLQYQLPDTEDLKAALEKTSVSILGRKLDPASLDRLANSYIGELKGVQEANYNATTAGAVQHDMPNVSTFADNAIRQQNPAESTAHDYTGAYDEFHSLLKESQSNVQQF